MIVSHFPLLSLLIWLPTLGAIPVLILGSKNIHPWGSCNSSRYLAIAIAIASLCLSVILLHCFNSNDIHMQFVENHLWIPGLNIRYHLGVDGISVPLVLLTNFTTLLVVLASWTMVDKKVPQYLAAFLVMQGMVIGVFLALDSMLFYFFWEAMLIPMYLGIGVWGSVRRSYAAMKFFLFTFFGSALLLVSLLYLADQGRTFSIINAYHLHLTMAVQGCIFGSFLLAFGIKIPIFPFHTWLPDAHTEAPAGGSVVLAALMLKIGAYGFIRFMLPIVPDACRYMHNFMIALSLIAIVYIGLIALVQKDMKKLIAYSSVAHMGFVTLGCFLIYTIAAHSPLSEAYLALEGAMVQMVTHAFGAGAMFLGFGIIYQQMKTRNIEDFGGVTQVMPYFAAFFMLFSLANVGLPGTSGFVGEFMVIESSFQSSFWVALAAASTLVVAASYTLWMFKQVFFGPIKNEAVTKLKDIGSMDRLILILLSLMILGLGCYPNPLLNLMHASTGHVLQLALSSHL